MTVIPDWRMKGDWFDVCSCDMACPCEFAQPPTNDHCEGVLAYHIKEGRFGDVVLDGLNVVSILVFDGNVWAGARTMRKGTYLDESANEDQRNALSQIFAGKAGGFIAGLSALLCEDRGVEFARIQLEVEEDLASWSVVIPGKVDAAVEALTGPTTPPGKRVQTLNPPGSEVGPGGPATWGVAKVNTVDAYGWKWDWAGKCSKHIPFDWVGP